MEKIRIENLSFTYPDAPLAALSDVSCDIHEGAYVALIGESGSGKTSLLKMLKPCLTPNGKKNGRICIDGCEIECLSEREGAEKIGYVMQDPDSQIVTDKVWHELAFGLENLGLDSDTIRLRCAETAEFFGITEWFERDVSTLSGGQKQLLNLASVMVMNPEILLLDEPVSQLDPIAAEDFLHTVKKINSECGVTVIISEHRLEEIFKDADKIAVMHKGKLVSFASPEETGRKSAQSLDFIRYAMPTPVKIYSEVTTALPCPLTIRDGREWLAKTVDKADNCYIERRKEAENESALTAKNVSFQYTKNGKRILDDVTVTFEKGKITAILGGNGAGKSTLLKVLAGIYKPVAGKIRPKDKKISYLPQNAAACFSENTVREDLLLISRDVEETVALTEIGDLLDRNPMDLSGGEMQKAATAKILLTTPDILLLDEPTKGFDGNFKRNFAAILRKIADSGKTVIIVSHDIEFCAAYTDICMMLFSGRVVACKAAREFFSGNTFYTTAAHRMSRGIFDNAVTVKEVVALCKKNRKS